MTANDDDFLSCFEGFENARVTLTDAVQYIAAANLRFGKTDRLNPWKAANEIVRAIQCGELTAYGQSDGRAITRVPVSAFSHADPYPSQDDYLIAHGSQRSLRWRDGRSPYGEGDAVVEDRRTVWRRIVVDRGEVVRIWPMPSEYEQRLDRPDSLDVDESVIRAFLLDQITKAGGYLSQNNGAKIVGEKYPDFDRDKAREITRTLTGNTKPGPRGPRKNRAG